MSKELKKAVQGNDIESVLSLLGLHQFSPKELNDLLVGIVTETESFEVAKSLIVYGAGCYDTMHGLNGEKIQPLMKSALIATFMYQLSNTIDISNMVSDISLEDINNSPEMKKIFLERFKHAVTAPLEIPGRGKNLEEYFDSFYNLYGTIIPLELMGELKIIVTEQVHHLKDLVGEDEI